MIMKTVSALIAGAALSVAGTTARADGHEKLTIAYFLEWPMPFQFAKVNGTYEKALGKKINWVSFESGVAMSAAMASGDIQIAVSQGIPPFVVATSGGLDLQAVDVAVSYSENDNCVVASALEIDKNSASELAGKKVAVPLGTAAHYGLIKQMNHFGVDLESLSVVDMAPAEGAAALNQGAVDMACGWGGALRRMKENGNVLLTGAEKEELGILVFDVTSAPASYIAENGDELATFLKVTAEANAMWNDEANRAEMVSVIARDAGMDEDATADTMATFVFPTVAEQLSDKWLGGGSQEFMDGVAQVFLEAGSIDNRLGSYAGTVNTGPLSAAAR
ncbi:ABC transporter substrate-binding protein [Sulfitobacter sp. S190]|uniref:taurine ABC transporter substrate-binding protein n=1 Tax=Sulfitobacter sp. S190 TaxID=2867022 RepID=UPI0021A569D9|nr:ABC transporter substrate-binding protein [Sulfitobacter sp. S190]UWR22769.1 ABC transporter substrate-binding protein [Sulfitobacter sp. S190]